MFGLGGKLRGVGADQSRQLDAQLGQGAARLDVAAGAVDQGLEQRSELRRLTTRAPAYDPDACGGQRREDGADGQPA
jgi:hypothetical protein